MKLIIDIDEITLESIMLNQYCGSKSDIEKIITNGIPYEEKNGLYIDRPVKLEVIINERTNPNEDRQKE